MPLKDILVQLEDSESANTRLELAVRLAEAHGSHLTGLYMAPPLPPADQARGAWYYMSDAALMSSKSRDENQAHAEMVERSHAAAARWEKGFAGITKKAGTQSDWILAEQALSDALTQHARFCDVAIVGQFGADSARAYGHAVVDQLLHSVGHAIMVIPPHKTFASLGKRIMIAWDRSPVALRAVHNARSFLRAADQVKILSVNLEPEYRGRAPGSGICEHLARHDIEAEPIHIEARNAKLSEVILSTAAKENSDLLVMGAYGRSGMRERILGSVTSTILTETEIPVLLSH